jgi:hypothetical protein
MFCVVVTVNSYFPQTLFDWSFNKDVWLGGLKGGDH